MPPGAGGESALATRDLSAAYDGAAVFCAIRFRLARGELAALVGPNGAGKTTLLHLLAGLQAPSSGDVILAGRTLAAYPRREVARRIAFVPQFSDVVPGVTVREAVGLGRYPWMGPLAPPSAADRRAVERALAEMDLAPLAERTLETLSGGERQRVLLARALAQETPVLLLDEPAANLDLRYQQETFARLRQLVGERQIAVLVAEHHLNLVAATCDRLLVLHAGRLWADGPPAEVVTDRLLSEVFGARMRISREASGPQCLWEFS